MEQNLLEDRAHAEFLWQLQLRLLSDGGDQKHESVLDCFPFCRQFSLIGGSVGLEQALHFAVDVVQNFLVTHAGFESDYLAFVLFDKGALSLQILVRLVVKEEFFQDLEEGVWVEVEEKSQELVIGEEADDIVDVAAPFK